MKQTLTTSEAADLLLADDNAAWTYAGARALVEYLEQEEQDSETETEFDRVAIRCNFSEYESALEAAGEYDFELTDPNDPDQNDEDREAEALSWLQDKTEVIEFEGGIIIRQF
jgi:hypothetical protein